MDSASAGAATSMAARIAAEGGVVRRLARRHGRAVTALERPEGKALG